MNAKSQPKLTANRVKQALKQLASDEYAQVAKRFFKTGPGQYSEEDIFWGIRVPDQRKVVRNFRDLPLDELDELLRDPVHECRFTAIILLVDRFRRTKLPDVRQSCFDFLLERTEFINNWDLVDTCAGPILGTHLLDQSDRRILSRLVRSKNLWEQRLAVVANQALIRNGDFDLILQFAEMLLEHPHDLIHKAVGWMLREMGNEELTALKTFLNQHASQMPRTMLRYAIEKLSKADRTKYMAQKS